MAFSFPFTVADFGGAFGALICEARVPESERTLPELISRSRRRDCSAGRASRIWRLRAETVVVVALGMKMGRSGSEIAKRMFSDSGEGGGSGAEKEADAEAE